MVGWDPTGHLSAPGPGPRPNTTYNTSSHIHYLANRIIHIRQLMYGMIPIPTLHTYIYTYIHAYLQYACLQNTQTQKTQPSLLLVRAANGTALTIPEPRCRVYSLPCEPFPHLSPIIHSLPSPTLRSISIHTPQLFKSRFEVISQLPFFHACTVTYLLLTCFADAQPQCQSESP